MMFLPQGTSLVKTPSDTFSIPSQEEEPVEFIPRVYGEDYSLGIVFDQRDICWSINCRILVF